jgi:hypothetical protein
MRGVIKLLNEKPNQLHYWDHLSTVRVSCGIDLWPVQLSFLIDTGLIVFNSFLAFLMGVVQYFAIDTEFTIHCRVGALSLLCW